MVELSISAVKIFLLILAPVGLAFHLLSLKNPAIGMKIEEGLGREFGLKKRCILWLEDNRMQLHNRLIKSRAYNCFASLSLLVIILLMAQI